MIPTIITEAHRAQAYTGGAVAVAFAHTALGIDHYLPFIVLGRAQKWNLEKVLGLTFLCGLAHVLSSVVLGLSGAALGITIQRWQHLHAIQGNAASWILIIFGFSYAGWAFARTRRLHRHVHEHDGQVHTHLHMGDHEGESEHTAKVITTWSLFIIFVLGPCEPLIPLMIVPALQNDFSIAAHVATVFSSVTVCSMLGFVTLGYYGTNLLPLRRLEVHANTLAGLAVAASGIVIRVFGV